MYESPIELEVKDIVSDVVKQVDEYTLRCFQQIGINIDKYELIKALEYDRGQYEKGWNDRDAEIVRCKDCKHYWKNSPMTDVPPCLVSPKDDAFCSEGERKENDKH